MSRRAEVLPNCKQGYHEDCVVTVTSFTQQRCSCGCHRSAIDIEHKPTTRDERVTSRHRSWHQHWAYAAFGVPASQGGNIRAYTDESIIQPPLTKEELWIRLQNGE